MAEKIDKLHYYKNKTPHRKTNNSNTKEKSQNPEQIP